MKELKQFIYITIAIVLVWIIFMIAMFFIYSNPTDRASFGDMFGAINTLFSGIAMAGVIVAIIMQKQELEMQRKELELTRKELAKTSEANVKQAKIQRLTAEIAGLSSLLEVTTNRLREPVIKGAARNGWNVNYVPAQLLEFQNSYMNSIDKRVRELAELKDTDENSVELHETNETKPIEDEGDM